MLEACKAGNPPKMGKWGSLPMNGQVSCEGPLGKTSLKSPFPTPGHGMRDDLTPKVPSLTKIFWFLRFAIQVNPADIKKSMGY